MACNDTEKRFLTVLRLALRGKRAEYPAMEIDAMSALLRLAAQQKLLPLIFDALYGCGAIPETEAALAYQKAARRQVLLQTSGHIFFRAVYTDLLQAGFQPLVVKGCLCRAVYPNGALRPSADEDLVVGAEAFAAANQRLQSLGFHPTTKTEWNACYEIGWRSPEHPLTLELHRSFFPEDSFCPGFNRLFTGSFDRAAAYEVEDGLKVLSLSAHDHLLYLLLHAMKHFIRSGFGLRQVCDIGLWAERYAGQIDWDRLEVQTASVHAERFSAAVLNLCRRELGLLPDLPPPWRGKTVDYHSMLEDLLKAGIYGSSSKSRQHTARVTQDAVASGRSGALRETVLAAFPPANSLRSDYPTLKKHPVLLPTVWARRIGKYVRQTQRMPENGLRRTLSLEKRRLELLREYGILESGSKRGNALRSTPTEDHHEDQT